MGREGVLKWVSVGDLQLRATDPWGRIDSETGRNTRTLKRLEALSFAVGTALEKEAHFLNVLGDLFDHPNPPEWLREEVWRIFTPLLEKLEGDGDRPVLRIIPGNHDWNGTTFPLAADAVLASALGGRVLICSRQEIVRHDLDGLPVELHYVPWHRTSSLAALSMFLRGHDVERVRVLFGHFPVCDAPGFLRDGAAVGADLARSWHYVELGDLHDPIGYVSGSWGSPAFESIPVTAPAERGAVAYVGCPVVDDFGELEVAHRGVWVSTLKSSFDAVRLSRQCVPFRDDPFYDLEVTPGGVVREVGRSAGAPALEEGNLESFPPNAVLRLTLRGPREWLASGKWKEILATLKTRVTVVRTVKVRDDAFLPGGIASSSSEVRWSPGDAWGAFRRWVEAAGGQSPPPEGAVPLAQELIVAAEAEEESET